MPLKRLLISLTLFPLMFLVSGCFPALRGNNAELDKRARSIKSVKMLSTEIKIYELSAGDVSELRDDWSAQARKNVEKAISEAMKERGVKATLLQPDSRTEGECADAVALYRAVIDSVYEHTSPENPNLFPDKVNNFDYTVGSPEKVAGRQKGEGLLIVIGSDEISSPGRKALRVAQAINPFAQAQQSGVTYVRMGGPFTSQAQNVAVDLPGGWMRLNTDEFIFVTRDGERLQNILIEAFHLDDTLKHTKKKLRKGMLPLESSEVIIDNIGSNQEATSFDVKENKSARVAGHQGFRALFTYRDRDGLKIKSVYYGFMDGEWFYGVRYTAPQRHYFDRDLKTFEKVVTSLKLAKSA